MAQRSARTEKQIAANIFKGSLGNMIEWFDWYVYASFAIYFSAAFFFRLRIKQRNCYLLPRCSQWDF